MKKILAILLACSMIFTLAACGPKEDDVTPGDIEIIEPSDTEGTTPDDVTQPNDDTTSPGENEEPNNPDNNINVNDPVTPDGDYTIDLSTEKAVYEKDGIKITFSYADIKTGSGEDVYEFNLENNSDTSVCVKPSSAIINGRSFVCSSKERVVAPGESDVFALKVYAGERKTVAPTVDDIKCVDFYVSIIEKEQGSYTYGKLIEENATLSLTDGQHDHRNDDFIINGRKMFENDEIVLYIDTTPTKDGFSDNYAFTVVNKTDRLLRFDVSKAEYKITTFDNPEFTSVVGVLNYAAPYSYYSGTFMLYDTKYDDLTEVKLILSGEYTNAGYISLTKSGTTVDYAGEVVTFNTTR